MARTGRPPKPDHIKLLTGTARPSRQRDTPTPTPGAERPGWLGPDACALWDKLAPDLTKDGILSERSSYWLALACDAMEKIQLCGRILTPEYIATMALGMNYPQALAIMKYYRETFKEASQHLGLSALDQRRISIAPTKPADDNGFAALG